MNTYEQENNDMGNDQQGNDQQGNDQQGNDQQGNDQQGNDQQGNDQQGNDQQGNDLEGNDHRGGEGDDRLEGRETDEHFAGGQGNDHLDGGNGLDDASYSGRREEYQLKSMDGTLELDDSVSTRDGHDQLLNIERVHFSDTNLAFDLDATQSAGKSALIVATCLGNEGLQDKASIKVLMDFFDSQAGADLNTAFQILTVSGIVGNLVGGSDDVHLIEWVGQKVLGNNFTAEIEKVCIDYTETHGQVDFLTTVASMGLNVDLVGLKANGLEFA